MSAWKRLTAPALVIGLLTTSPAVATSNVSWAKRPLSIPYGAPADLVLSPDGETTYVTGYGVDYWDNYVTLTLAYDTSTGGKKWEHRWSIGNQPTFTNKLAVDPSGRWLFITGSTRPVYTQEDAVTVALDSATGNELWVSTHPKVEYGGEFVAASPDGNRVYIVGREWFPGRGVVVAYDAETGREIWVAKTETGPNAAYLSRDGTALFIAGESPFRMFATSAWDTSTGSLLWSREYGEHQWGDQEALDLAVNPDGRHVYVTGIIRRSVLAPDLAFPQLATVAYESSSGSQTWAIETSALAGDYAPKIAVSTDGLRVYGSSIGGSVQGVGDWTSKIRALDALTGAPLWITAKPLAGWASGFALALDGSRVYVALDGLGSFSVAGFDSITGANVWSGSYMPEDPQGRAVHGGFAVTPNGTHLVYAGSLASYWSPPKHFTTISFCTSLHEQVTGCSPEA